MSTVRRRGDRQNSYLEIYFDVNDDAYVRVGGSSKGSEESGYPFAEAQVEFCVPNGGGYHPKTLAALHNLAKAIEEDNEDLNCPERYRAEFVEFDYRHWKEPKKEPKKGAKEFSPKNFVVFVPRGDKMIPIRIEIAQDWIIFAAVPNSGEEGEEDALQLIDAIKSAMGDARMVIECMTRHIDAGHHRIDKVKVATA